MPVVEVSGRPKAVKINKQETVRMLRYYFYPGSFQRQWKFALISTEGWKLDVVNLPCGRQHQHGLKALLALNENEWMNFFLDLFIFVAAIALKRVDVIIAEGPTSAAWKKPSAKASRLLRVAVHERKTIKQKKQFSQWAAGEAQGWLLFGPKEEKRPSQPAQLERAHACNSRRVQKSICLSARAQRHSSSWSNAHPAHWERRLCCWQTYPRHLMELITWLM